MSPEEQRVIAETVRKACLEAARAASEDARISGLCADGALEAALGTIEMLDLDAVIAGRRVGH